MIRLLIADDEKLERDALTEMVARRFDEHQVVLETAENGRKAADSAILWGADLILMDIEMPGMSGLDAARAVLAQRPGPRWACAAAPPPGRKKLPPARSSSCAMPRTSPRTTLPPRRPLPLRTL